MNSLFVAIAAIALFSLGYRFYSRKIERLWDVDATRKTPAIEKFDRVDFVPAKHWSVLFGHHFASIAGAAPIIGPVIAVSIWGWAPALLWIVLGTIFIGGVHDFGSLMISVRHGARSIADITATTISQRAKIVFSLFVWLTLILIIAVFVFFCAKTLTAEPKIAIPTLGLIPIAILVGFLLYRLKLNQVLATVLGLALLGGLIVLGIFFPLDLGKNAFTVWAYFLLIYAFFASVTPVNILLQPRDYLSAFLLVIGVFFGYAGLIISRPQINLPLYIGWNSSSGALWPMLFVTVACGAVSGFHSLIASGTTSKQLANEKDARKIGYGAMVMEGVVALLALLAITAGLKSQAALSIHMANEGPIGAFSRGYAGITACLLGGFGGLVAIIVLNSFILTTLDTATRIGRYLTQEMFRFKNRYLSTMIVVVLGGLLALSGNWSKIWPIFGAANQLVAALALVVITSWLLSRNKIISYTLLPALIMLATTIAALVYQIIHYSGTRDFLLVGIAFVLLVLAVYMLGEVVRIFARRRARG